MARLKSEIHMWLLQLITRFIFTLSLVIIVSLVLSHAQAALYSYAAGQDVIGESSSYTIQEGDNFLQLAQVLQVGFQELVDANPQVDPWIPEVGELITIPTQYVLPKIRKGIVINLAELRLYYFHPQTTADSTNRQVSTFAISVGKSDQWSTPLASTYIIAKHKQPSWYPPESIRQEHEERNDPLPKIVPPGPDNPLGDYSLRLALPGYLIHGTNVPEGIGMRVTHGCIRMHPTSIEQLFSEVSLKTPVNIINQAYKAGWKDNKLYLEAHAEIEEQALASSSNLTEFVQTIVAYTSNDEKFTYTTSWEQGYQAARVKTGLPTAVVHRVAKQ